MENYDYKFNNPRNSSVIEVMAGETRKPCCRKETARCRSCCFWFI